MGQCVTLRRRRVQCWTVRSCSRVHVCMDKCMHVSMTQCPIVTTQSHTCSSFAFVNERVNHNLTEEEEEALEEEEEEDDDDDDEEEEQQRQQEEQ